MAGNEIIVFPEKIKNVAIYNRIAYVDKDNMITSEPWIYPIKCFISEHPAWNLKSIYLDNGHEHKELEHLLEDCNNGKFDLIITTSTDRFSRNIVKTIEIVRSLRKLNIGVFFFTENIYSIDSTYDGGEKSNDAIKSKKYRDKLKHKAKDIRIDT